MKNENLSRIRIVFVHDGCVRAIILSSDSGGVHVVS